MHFVQNPSRPPVPKPPHVSLATFLALGAPSPVIYRFPNFNLLLRALLDADGASIHKPPFTVLTAVSGVKAQGEAPR